MRLILTKHGLKFNNRGFTVIELIVAIFIIGLLASLFIANVAGQRAARNIKLAQNQLVTDIRKIQSYTLSSHNFGAISVQYYVLKIDLSKPRQYIVQAMYNVSSSPTLVNMETDSLPQGIRFAQNNAVTINGSGVSNACALLAFGTPYADAYMNDGCSPINPSLPYSISTGDDYNKIVTFAASNGTVHNNSTMVLTLTDDNNTYTKSVTVNGVTGVVTFQ